MRVCVCVCAGLPNMGGMGGTHPHQEAAPRLTKKTFGALRAQYPNFSLIFLQIRSDLAELVIYILHCVVNSLNYNSYLRFLLFF